MIHQKLEKTSKCRHKVSLSSYFLFQGRRGPVPNPSTLPLGSLCGRPPASYTRSAASMRCDPDEPALDQPSGLSLLGPMKSTPSIGMSFSLMAFCTQCWYFRKLSVHGSPLRSPFRNFSANQRLKHWSYSRFRSVHASPTLFISDDRAETETTRRNVGGSAASAPGPAEML